MFHWSKIIQNTTNNHLNHRPARAARNVFILVVFSSKSSSKLKYNITKHTRQPCRLVIAIISEKTVFPVISEHSISSNGVFIWNVTYSIGNLWGRVGYCTALWSPTFVFSLKFPPPSISPLNFFLVWVRVGYCTALWRPSIVFYLKLPPLSLFSLQTLN